jgi:hypothetical protein
MATDESTNREIRDRVDGLSLQLYHVAQTLKVAAFACEARRVLDDIYHAAEYRPDFKAVLSTNVKHMGQWEEMEDATSEVIGHAARLLESINTEWTEAAYKAAEARHV